MDVKAATTEALRDMLTAGRHRRSRMTPERRASVEGRNLDGLLDRIGVELAHRDAQ